MEAIGSGVTATAERSPREPKTTAEAVGRMLARPADPTIGRLLPGMGPRLPTMVGRLLPICPRRAWGEGRRLRQARRTEAEAVQFLSCRAVEVRLGTTVALEEG